MPAEGGDRFGLAIKKGTGLKILVKRKNALLERNMGNHGIPIGQMDSLALSEKEKLVGHPGYENLPLFHNLHVQIIWERPDYHMLILEEFSQTDLIKEWKLNKGCWLYPIQIEEVRTHVNFPFNCTKRTRRYRRGRRAPNPKVKGKKLANGLQDKGLLDLLTRGG